MEKVTITRREIDAALAHASTDTTRSNLVSVKVSRKAGWTRLESTDGRRLIRIQHKEEGPDEYCESLNTEDLKTVSKLVSGAAANPNGRDIYKLRSFALSPKDKREEVKAEVVALDEPEGVPFSSSTLRTVAGRFPDTDMIVPDVVANAKDYVRVTVNPELLIDAAKAIYALCSTDAINTVQLHVKDATSPILLTAEHSVNGTRVAVMVMPIRDNNGFPGAPYPEKETT